MQRSVALAVGVALLVLVLAVGIFMRQSQPGNDAGFAAPAPVVAERSPLRPPVPAHNLAIDSQVVFLYYEDLVSRPRNILP